MVLVKHFGKGLAPCNMHFKGYFRTEVAVTMETLFPLSHMGPDIVHVKPNCKRRITIVTSLSVVKAVNYFRKEFHLSESLISYATKYHLIFWDCCRQHILK